MTNSSNFQTIYSDHSSLVFNVCLNYLRNAEDAEEATQDVFIKVHAQHSRFNEKSSLKTWIYRIAINTCLDRIKAQKAQKRFAQIQSLFGLGTEEKEPADYNHPGIELEDREAVSEIMDAIHDLPVNQKTAIILKSIEGLSQKEMSAVMELGEKAVESLLSRAKANLKKKLNDRKGNKI